MNKREIEEQAILAFNAAVENDFISTHASVHEIEYNAYEILGFMPDFDIEDLSDEEYDYAVEILKAQLYQSTKKRKENYYGNYVCKII